MKRKLLNGLTWLLVLMQLFSGIAVADTTVTGTTFTAATYTGGYTVTFYSSTGEKLCTVDDVDFGTSMETVFAEAKKQIENYEDNNYVWSVTNDYKVLNDLSVYAVGEAVAMTGGNTCGSIGEAINAVVDGDTIYLLKDTSENISVAGKNFTLDMGGHTIKPADPTASIFTQSGGEVTLLQGTLTGAIANTNGGAISVTSGTLNAEYVQVKNNTTTGCGGGIYAKTSDLTLKHCAVTGNTTTTYSDSHGGGVYVQATSSSLPVITIGMEDCEISNNEAMGSGGGIYTTNRNYVNLNINNVVVKENKSRNGAGGIYADASGGITDSTISGNKSLDDSAVDAGGIDLVGAGSSFTLSGCTISGNSGLIGGILIKGGSSTYKSVSMETCQVTGNKSTGSNYADGIFVQYGNLEAGSGNAIYNNPSAADGIDIARSGGYAYSSLNICAANAMSAKDQNFENWFWEGKNSYTTGLKVGDRIYVSGSPYYVMAYKAVATQENVAAITRDGVTTSYTTLLNAIAAAENGETIDLIREASDGKPADVSTEPATVGGENQTLNLTLNLNGRGLIGAQEDKNVLTVNSGSALTVIGSGFITKNDPVNYASIYNYGTLEIKGGENGITVDRLTNNGTDAKMFLTGIITVSEKGRILLGTGTITVGGEDSKITVPLIAFDANNTNGTLILDKGADVKTVTMSESGQCIYATSAFSIEDEMTIKLVKDDLTALNTAYQTGETVEVVLVKPCEGSTLSDELAEKISVSDANNSVQILKNEEGFIVARAQPIDAYGVFIDGVNGNDSNDGLTIDTPVKTFDKAVEVLKGRIEQAENDTEGTTAYPDGIYVLGTITVSGSTTMSMEGLDYEKYSLIRYPTFTGAMVAVTGSGNLTLQNITLDGNKAKTVAETEYALVTVAERGTLNIKDGTTLKNNAHTGQAEDSTFAAAGGAVYCSSGTVNMSGGKITDNESWFGGGICLWGGTLTMKGGEISSNTVTAMGDYSPQGGGVYLGFNAKMTMDDGTISYNKGAKNGGGIMVGGVIVNYKNGARLKMNGGTIAGNRSTQEGGGIYVEDKAEATILGGVISGNTCRGGYYGGGGIYVNGARDGYEQGKLFLENVIISDNESVDEGGGIAACSTSTTNIYLENGGAIYNNESTGTDVEEVFIDGGIVADFKGIPKASISAYTLDGQAYNWVTSVGTKMTPAMLSSITGTIKLNNSVESVDLSKASVFITNNTSDTRGGGIGSNGFVQIGTVPTTGAWTPAATKTLTGRDMKEGEFTFEVYEQTTDEDDKVTLTNVSTGTSVAAKDGESAKISFTSISLNGKDIGTEHTYVIQEVIPDELPSHMTYDSSSYTVNITVVVGADGNLTGDVTSITKTPEEEGEQPDSVSFKNTYTPDATSYQPKVEKALSGEPTPSDKSFVFTLSAVSNPSDGAELPETTQATRSGAGVAQFGAIRFTKAGTYEFAIAEEKGEETGYSYDTEAWKLTVTVTDDNGTLTASPEYTRGESVSSEQATFTNVYKPTECTYQPVVTKTVNGNTPDDQTFQFILTQDAAQTGAILPDPATAQVVGSGTAEFGAITFTSAGEYHFTLSEQKGGSPGYDYDETAWTLTVKVEDKNGVLTVTKHTYSAADRADSDSAASFINNYTTTSVKYTPVVEKRLAGVAAPENKTFQFVLAAKETNPEGAILSETTATVTGAGTAEFGEITFTQRGTYAFTIRETQGSEAGYSYDESEWTLKIEVTDIGGALKVASVGYTKADGSAEASAVFTNTYAPAETTAILSGSKTVTGSSKPQTDETFTFVLTGESGDTPMPAGSSGRTATKTVTGSGNFSFQITYTKPGKYVYRLYEQNGGATGYDYDERVYAVTVMVTDTDGVLSSAVTYALEGGTVESAAFENIYESGSLTITKHVRGYGASRSRAFPFKVVLTDAEGNRLTGSYSFTGTGGAASSTIVNGETDITLAHGQSIRIDGLPAGAKYQVEETEYEGYTPDSAVASGTITPDGATAAFTNRRNYNGEVPKTGYGEDNGRLYAIGACLVIALLAAIVRRRLRPVRRHRADNRQ